MDFIYVITPRKRVKDALSIIKEFDSHSFISITDVRSTYAGFLNNQRHYLWWPRYITKKK